MFKSLMEVIPIAPELVILLALTLISMPIPSLRQSAIRVRTKV